MALFKDGGGRQTTIVFPIISRKPSPETSAIEIPETEAQRVRLYAPARIIVTEFNTDDLAASFALEDRGLPGRYSGKFMSMVASRAAAAIRAARMTGPLTAPAAAPAARASPCASEPFHSAHT
jgi:hypothetical protein